MQGALKACKTVDAVLALFAQCNPRLLNARIVSAALQRLARCTSDHYSALKALYEMPEFQRMLSLAQHNTPQMEWRTLVTVARALAKLKCADAASLAPIEGTQGCHLLHQLYECITCQRLPCMLLDCSMA